MLGQLSARKNAWATIDAWGKLKRTYPEFASAELHLKSNNAHIHPSLEHVIPQLRVYNTSWPTETVREFYGAMHCLVSPSRGEGNLLPGLEFITSGGAFIGTNWGGIAGWLTPEIGYPLDYTLTQVQDSPPGVRWANVATDHLAETMLHVFRNREEARQKALVGSKLLPKTKSWDTYVARMIDIVSNANLEHSVEISHKSALCKRP
jgi:glycosyltransferase involved in cell wall biosynthesis